MGIEKYIAAASLGLFIMFVGEIITIYDFMITPQADIITGPIGFEPDPKILQFISIGVAPAVILVGSSYIMARQYGSKPIGLMIIAGGSVLLIGMTISYTMIEQIDKAYLVNSVIITPPLFMVVSIPVIIFGIKLLKQKKTRPKKEYF